MSSNVIMYIKGVSKGNPGPAGVGVIICDHWGRIIKKISECIGISTALQSEFRALLRGIEEIRSMNAGRAKIFSDNETVIKHMTGIYNIKADELVLLLEQVKALSKGLYMEFIQIHPIKNKEAEIIARESIEKDFGKIQPLPTKSKDIPKGDIDVKAIRSAVQRAMLFEEITKGQLETTNPEQLREKSSEIEKKPQRPPLVLQKSIHQEEKHDSDNSEDICMEEREERQISAGGVVYKKEGHKFKVCIISKKNKRIWALPKGRLNPGENPIDTAKREISEETGHLTEVREKIDEINYYFYWKEASTLYHKTVYFFLMPLVEENYCIRDNEADEVIWVTLGEAYKKLTYINEKEVLKKAQKILMGK